MPGRGHGRVAAGVAATLAPRGSGGSMAHRLQPRPHLPHCDSRPVAHGSAARAAQRHRLRGERGQRRCGLLPLGGGQPGRGLGAVDVVTVYCPSGDGDVVGVAILDEGAPSPTEFGGLGGDGAPRSARADSMEPPTVII